MSNANRSPFRLDTDLTVLRSLIAVIEEGSFSAAAEKVGRTQSAISLQIAKLEERLDVKLFERTSRSLSQTSEGEIFIGYARKILELADEAVLSVSAPKEQSMLRVGFAEYLVPQHLHIHLARFKRAHPTCDLNLILGGGADLLCLLDAGELDVVFAGPEASGGKQLWQEPLVWCGQLPAADKPLELILMQEPCSYRAIAISAMEAMASDWKISITANSIQAVQSAIKAGLGVSILPASALLEDIPVIESALPGLPVTSVLSYLSAQEENPLAQRFIDYLLCYLEKTGALQTA
ncbi:DNA-binding transcriptional regulator, LysR family [Pseudovibrio ascidiaceicola]|uniref:DNA-binding transcriptional regulator, LysR family n=1 Tax=Pseudovibrio ascidiaceicola TaxID=285279 RepID=A0A1I4FLR9_9HYPH|nr:LysR substrate-binding domain-containing protein [Pseudovibrio ascidiaceicola]SFL18824.1 DNA-binding transcriptional regulator, LysR family [Pseudovibrio ascidiaceicola]